MQIYTEQHNVIPFLSEYLGIILQPCKCNCTERKREGEGGGGVRQREREG